MHLQNVVLGFTSVYYFDFLFSLLTVNFVYIFFLCDKINSLLQRRDLRAAALHLLYAGTAKAEENSTRKGCRVTDAMRC